MLKVYTLIPYTLLPNFAQSRDGRLRRGDELLMINGRSLVGLSHQEAVDALRGPGDHVTLVVASKINAFFILSLLVSLSLSLPPSLPLSLSLSLSLSLLTTTTTTPTYYY